MTASEHRSFPTRAAFRAWLAANHADKDELWLVYFKKTTGKPSIDYAASVEEALCFGWIDGLKKRIDGDRYTHRFTPRRRGSRWSPSNIARVERLLAAGRMTPAGVAAFEQGSRYDARTLAAIARPEIPLTAEIEKALRRNRRAWKNFNALSRSERKRYVGWLRGAKRSETLRKRLAAAIALLEQNVKLRMK